MVKRIIHFSTGHVRKELRVHLKQCNSLAATEQYEVHFVTCDGGGEARMGDVHVHDIGSSGGRAKRLLLRPWKMLKTVRAMDGDILHFHDPELLLIAPFLTGKKAKVIYDAHEDVPSSLRARKWMHPILRPFISTIFKILEDFVSKRLDAIITATPEIGERFEKLNDTTVVVNNYPLANEIEDEMPLRQQGGRMICYHGGISLGRGIVEIIQALELLPDVNMVIAGTFDRQETKDIVTALPAWSRVDYRGQVTREEVREIMGKSHIGLVLFLPEPNHVAARPNKLFEYMSAGLPSLASDFPNWRQLLSETQSGHFVDPENPKAIAAEIEAMLADPDGLAQMGHSGREAVLTQFVWDKEALKLFALYDQLLSQTAK